MHYKVTKLHKWLAAFCVALLPLLTTMAIPVAAVTTLSPGDIVVIGIKADNPDDFAFVPLVDLEAGTQIVFTDSGWTGSAFRGGEGAQKYTASAAITAGTVISFIANAANFTAANDANVGTNGVSLSTDGDQIIAFQGASGSPTFIFAAQINSNQWQTGSTNAQESALPTGLTAGVNAVAAGAGAGAGDEFDNAWYSGITSGTKAQLLAAVANNANWTGNDATYTPFTTNFTISGSGTGQAPTIAESTTTAFLNLPAVSPGYVSGVVSDPTDPATTLGIDFTLADTDTPVGNLTVAATSNNQTVVPNANLALTGSGASRNLKITPAAVGYATITVTVSDGTNSASYVINYAASAASATPSSSRFHTGKSDASTAIAIDANYMLVADDEDQTIRLYHRTNSGLPVAQFDYTSSLSLVGTNEVDIEGATRVGNRIYWQGSHSNNSGGNDNPNRERIFATDLSGTGAAATLTFVGFYQFLEDDLVVWDSANGHGLGANALGLAASISGLPEAAGGFNIEGLSMAPGSSTMAYVGFRAPLMLPGARTKALIVPVTNYPSLLGAATGTATFGAPIQLNLGGLGLRSIECSADGCLLIAGAADGAGNFKLFTWSGNAADAPQERAAALPVTVGQESFESIVELPATNFLGANGDALIVQLLRDNGDTPWYGDGTTARNLTQENFKKFRSDLVTLGAVTSDNSAPTVSTLSPVAGATDAAVGNDLAVTFNEPVQRGSGTIVIKRSADDSIFESFDAATSNLVTVSGNQVSINPTTDLAANTSYYVEIASGTIQDLAGNGFAGISGNSTWNFTTSSVAAPLYDLQITEIWAGQSGTPLTGDWFEITNRGTEAWVAATHPALYYDDDSQSTTEADLINNITQIDPGESVIVVVGTSATVATTFSTVWSPVVSLTDIGWVNGAGLGQGGDGVAIWVGGPAGLPNDFAAYPALASGIAYDVDLAAASVVGNAAGAVATIALSGTEPAIGSPGRTNQTAAPTVTTLDPTDGATSVAVGQNLVITFNKNVQKGTGNITIQLVADNAVVQTIDVTNAAVTVSGAQVTINPPADLALETAYYVNIAAGALQDTFGNNFAGITTATTWNFTTVGPTITKISAIQGSGDTATSGTFTVEAIVVGDYQTQGSGQLRGFFLQEEDADADGNAATAEGIFVFCTTCPTPVAVGDKVQVTGATSEFFNMSQLTASTAGSVTVLNSNNTLPTPATIQLPVPGLPSGNLAAATTVINAYFEPFEGMLVTFPDTLAVSEYFELARYGQVILNEGGRPRTFSDANSPSTTGLINHEIELASRTIILDDTDNRQNRPVDTPNTNYYHPVPGLSTSNFFRGGDTITNLTGVLHWSFAGQTGTDAWRIRPVTPQYNYAFTPVNTRPAVPTVGGTLKVASFNVLNYFLTIDTTSSSTTGSCGASATLDCRGADNTTERDQQQAKLTAALNGLGADIFGLIELENTPNVDPLAEIVADLNAVAGAGTYATINTGVVGTDAIKVGFIYKPSAVTPIGAPMIDNNAIHNRPPVAQLFETATGGRFTVVVNHFKSKGCTDATGTDTDQLDGQGCYNPQRVAQANALLSFATTITTQTGDPDVLLIGDLNSYAKEDPITTLQNGGFTNLVAQFGGNSAYSYVFDGQLGYLDHALANASLTAQVTGVADWHINADENPLFDYNDDVKDTGEGTFEEESDTLPLYAANAFRTSDHDPVVIGLNLVAPEIDVLGNSQSIVNGDVTPSAADHSDFGSMDFSSGTVVRTFTIQNTGAGALTLPGATPVTVSGTNAADFTVTTQPAGSVAANGSTTFAITFDPSALGVRTATVTIAHNDSNEAPYTFALQGVGAERLVPAGRLVQIGTPTQVCSNVTGTYIKQCTVTFTLQNTSGGPLTIGHYQITTLSPHVYVLNGEPTPGQVGALVMDPRIVANNATFQPQFVLGLTSNTRYSINFRVFGYVGTSAASITDAFAIDNAQLDEIATFTATLEPVEVNATFQLYLPVVQQ